MEETVELDMKEVFSALVRRIWLIIMCVAVAATLAWGATLAFVVPQYQASVYMYVNNRSATGGNSITSSELTVAKQLVNTYINIIKRDAVLEDAAMQIYEETGVRYSSDTLRRMLSASSVEETELFQLRVTHPNKELVAVIANKVADVSLDVISDTIEGSSAKIIDYAKPPKNISSPNYVQNTVIGGFIGAVVAVAGVVLSVILDKRIKSEEELAKICSAPVLGNIPNFAAENKAGYYRQDDESRKTGK